MYQPPIKIYETAMETIIEQRENAIFAKVQDAFDVHVDKDELIRALQYDRGQYEKGYADGKADAVQQWIPASEPPKDTNEYWIAYKAGGDYYYSTGYFDGKCWCSVLTHHKIPVTHWMPLPQPPKEG